MQNNIDISVVIPLFNEEESLPELCSWIDKVMQSHDFSYEVLMIDDGSTDKSWNIIENISKENPNVLGVKFRRNYGKSAALQVGFKKVSGRVIITMDADLQDSPDEIPELYDMITKQSYHLVSGWKKKRHDPLSKTIPTKLFNAVTRRLSGIKLHDFNCGLKAYDCQVVKDIEIQGEMHRYIPVIAKWAGFQKIGEKVVQHQARKFGVSKFGMNRFINGFLDLCTITFVSKFGKKPMHLFGALGTIMFIIGFLISLWMGIDKLFIDETGRLITERPLFFIALTTMVLGTVLFLTGFLAELIIRNNPRRNQYLVEKEIKN